jgi:hypothetical protein
MEDEVVSNLKDNHVVHRKSLREYDPTGLYHVGGSGSAAYTHYGSTVVGQSEHYATLGGPLMIAPNGGFINKSLQFPNTSDASVVQSLYDNARREVAQGLVNLIEARKLSSTFESIARVLPRKRQAFKAFFNKLKSWRGSKDISSATLAYQFGIAPLLTDIQNTCAFISDASNLVDRYERGARQVSSRVFSLGMMPEPTSVLYTMTEFRPTFSWVLAPKLRYSLVYRYRRSLFDWYNKAQFILQRMGFLSPARVAWELTPWSFVVDWFFDTSGLLMRLDDILGFDPIETISLTKSVKWIGKIDITKIVYTSLGIGASYRCASDTYSYYWRLPLGRTTYVGPSNRFGKKQTLLSIALARQRLR